LSSLKAHFGAKVPLGALSVKVSLNIPPVQINTPFKSIVSPRHPPEAKGLLKRRANSSPPFNPRGEGLLGTLQGPPAERQASLQVPFNPPSYSRKPGPQGQNMSICAKGVSRGVHNIAFLLSPDRFRAFDLFFLHILQPGGVWHEC
jgi:hypothetical protein